jgi:hypothetical protein
MRKSVGQAPTAERANKRNKKKKPCRTSSDIGAEQENHNVRRGPTLDQKGINHMISTAQRFLFLDPVLNKRGSFRPEFRLFKNLAPCFVNSTH